MHTTETATPTLETPARPGREALDRERAELTAERARLALDDPHGSRLALVRARLQEISGLLDDVALAAAEEERRVVAAAAAARAQRVAQERARLEVLETVEIPAVARAADAALTAAAQSLARLQTLNAQAARLRTGLGLASRQRADALALEGHVAWRFAAVLGRAVRTAHHALRVPLAELFTPAAPDPAPARREPEPSDA
jgi:hypothetical protein